ncbi:serine/threonine-protein kinase haspin-like [Ruditapes philippinarum]|uniref:serine/threonine-protein kinase haspin-like n=1 Tax=Ruditapes philippinarum TaxID=129788 RepID=UPI00295A8A9F|nr:serine/threonine-protein kinase haspin-like [Ruditapes philippinarum]
MKLSVNFSDFDNLVVSDFPPVEIRNKDSNLLSVDTSTPLSKRTRHKAVSVTENASDATENKVDRYEEEYEEENGREDDTEESEEDSKTEGNSDDSENEQDESNNYSRVGDLSAIHEHVSDVESGSESDSGNCDIVESESDEEEKECDRRITRRMDKSSKSNLERLSINHINQRRNTRMTRVIQCHEDINDLAELLVESHIDSSETNAILYLQNDELVTDDNQEEIEYVSRSEYHTAHSSRYSDYHSAEYDDADVDDGNNGSGDVGDKDNDEEVVKDPSTPINNYRLCVKFQELQNSFSELLTPKKRKSSKVSLSARAKILILCDQTEPITFTTALTKKMISKCRKIGEGVYGEVFRAINSNGDSIAFKIIPIEGDFEVNDEKQKKFAEILPEVVIAKELSNLRNGKTSMTSNFCEVNNLSCVKGRYPAELLKQWDIFNKNKGSENDRPDVFPEKQLYIMLEFDDCGTDLESYKFTTIHQAKSVLTQVGYALAVAEEALQFEHRDLHWGNVLVRPTDKEDITFRLKGRPVVVSSHGVEACVIDFSMSRLTKDGCTVYTTIPDDDTLFDGKGDYQFDVYREMKKENKGNWEKLNPHSNVLWLHYLADKLVYHTKYPSHSSRQERDVLREFRQFMSTMIDYSSSLEMTADSLFMNS